jgi:hypothetical protein
MEETEMLLLESGGAPGLTMGFHRDKKGKLER